ncbi:MAG: N-acetylmuramoyl-L-alanine amidase [Bacteroidales bacterium]|jgi:N-acetylmuramoyl-L-alanine amidase
MLLLSVILYGAESLVPEKTDVSLRERVRRVNTQCEVFGPANVILVSIHVNAAAADGKWHKATSWSAFTTPEITKSDLLAYDLYKAAKKNLQGKVICQFNGPKEPDFEKNFYILKHTKCPAVLTKNFFMDNIKDINFLNRWDGERAISHLHIEGIDRLY